MPEGKIVTQVNPIITPSPAKNFDMDPSKIIDFSLKSQDSFFIPTRNKSNMMILRANIGVSRHTVIGRTINDTIDVSSPKSKSIGRGECVEIDCGFEVMIPHGYKLILSDAEFVKKGYFINGIISSQGDQFVSVKALVANVSNHLITIKHKDEFAIMYCIPDYYVNWNYCD